MSIRGWAPRRALASWRASCARFKLRDQLRPDRFGLVVLGLALILAGCGPDSSPAATGELDQVAPAKALPDSAGSGIVGSWSSVDGPYEATYEYRSDGQSLQYVGGRVRGPFPYRVEGDSIVVTATMPSGRVLDERSRFSLEGDTLIFFDGDGETRSFRRTEQGQD